MDVETLATGTVLNAFTVEHSEGVIYYYGTQICSLDGDMERFSILSTDLSGMGMVTHYTTFPNNLGLRQLDSFTEEAIFFVGAAVLFFPTDQLTACPGVVPSRFTEPGGTIESIRMYRTTKQPLPGE